MSSPIQSTNVAQYQPYCTAGDINNLIGNVITNASYSSNAIASYIAEAVEYINRETNIESFSPYRSIERYDGNGGTRMTLRYPNVMAINQVSVFFTYPLALSRIAREWDLLIDRKAGLISFPTYTSSPMFAPFAFTFYRASQNVEVDAWYGFTRNSYGETLTTTDNLTFPFANPTAIKQATQVTYPYAGSAPPQYGPTVYLNGAPIVNTTYTLVASNLVTTNDVWEINQDNLVYTLNTSANGITGITFTQPVSGVITADYAYWHIPADIQVATAKRAAITVLSAIASGIFQDNQYNGVEQLMIDGSRIQSITGQFGSIIARWQAEIAEVIARYRQTPLDFQGGFDSSIVGGICF